MNIKVIISEYLRSNGYDGLVGCDGVCGCLIDDLAPCDEMNSVYSECEPAYNHGTKEDFRMKKEAAK